MLDQKEACHMVHSRLSSSASAISFIGNWVDRTQTHLFKTWKDVERKDLVGGLRYFNFNAGRDPLTLD